MATWLFALALALSPAPMPEADAPPAPAEIMAIPAPLRSQFAQWNGDAVRGPEQRLEQLVTFLFDETRGLGLQYHFEANHTVAEVYATRQVNCLSFTLITVALAREAGLDAYAQEIEDVLTWFQEGSTVYRNNHVNAGFLIHRQRFSADVAWNEVITRQEPRRIDDAHLYALFYNNRAVAMLGKGERAQAKAYAERAIAYSGDYAAFWNNLGVMAYRNGDRAQAESDYRHAISLNDKHSPALFNLIALYKRNGQAEAARPLEKKLARIRDRDPFDQFLLALESERTGDYATAIKRYQHAIRLHPEEPRFFEGLARAYFLQGDARRAGRALERARNMSRGEEQARYQAKLERLRKKEIEGQRLFGPDPRLR